MLRIGRVCKPRAMTSSHISIPYVNVIGPRVTHQALTNHIFKPDIPITGCVCERCRDMMIVIFHCSLSADCVVDWPSQFRWLKCYMFQQLYCYSLVYEFYHRIYFLFLSISNRALLFSTLNEHSFYCTRLVRKTCDKTNK